MLGICSQYHKSRRNSQIQIDLDLNTDVLRIYLPFYNREAVLLRTEHLRIVTIGFTAVIKSWLHEKAAACIYVYTELPRRKGQYSGRCPIPNGFRDRAISLYSSFDLVPNTVVPSSKWIGTKRQLAVATVDSSIVRVL
jgi:hypothetical protein